MKSIVSHIRVYSQQYWSEITWIYLVQLFFGMVCAMMIYRILGDSIGYFPEASHILFSRWDYTTINDIMQEYGDVWASLRGQICLVVLAYLVLSVYLQGAMLDRIVSCTVGLRSFVRAGARLFLPFLGYALLFFVLLAFWTALIWYPFISKSRYMMEYWTDERWMLWIGIALTIVYLLGCYYLFLASVTTRCRYITTRSWLSSFRYGATLSARGYWSMIPLGLFAAILIGLLYYANLRLESALGITSFGLIILFFVVQQVIVWTKIALRTSLYAIMHSFLK